MVVQRFIEKILDQYGSDKEPVYPGTLQDDLVSYLRTYNETELSYLWAGLVKTYSRSFKRLPGIAELEKAWEKAKERIQEGRHPDIDPLCEYNPMQIEEDERVDEEEAKNYFDEMHRIFHGISKDKGVNNEQR